MEYPELPFFSFLAAVLVLIPLPWHWRARNIATVSLIIWLFLVDVVYGINSLIWNENVENAAPVWCDITSKIIVGASYALPLATLCICKHLEMVSSSRKVSFDYADRRHRMLFEAFMCFGLPAIFMALHYIVQGHRFDIFENTGCQAAVYISIPAILIIWLPQLLFSVVTMIYATIAIYHFIHRRLIFASHIQNTDSALTTNRYLRLIAMAFTEMIWCTTLTSYNLYNNITGGLRPWTTWADVHSNFLRVDQFLEMAIPPDFRQVMMLFWWAMPVSSFIFFIFFGFGEEARKEYIKIWQWSKESILRRSEKEMASSSTSGSP
ncbi:fungal pheromone STE3G-protein-coupled receptor [Macrolepiota fuliginosa MF-IS2]|uniref:Fungal pheromone STE3G-protein-coupled receptor n=1 Tax=Macrolepiota fuliginosa MF-IS2 TaxID=1400762 RepID=A0A9P5XE55_9AGAR|nr:fungal pheromone STE3G-protein-coupled receptor [Macrolepiota fuliginosa MF-IS2]